MVVRTHIPSIAGGGVQSPAMLPRTDLKRQSISLREVRNFLPRVQGGAVRRTGTIFVALALSQAKPGALKRFAFSRREGRIIEFGDLQMRFFKERALVLSAGLPVIVTTPYPAEKTQAIRLQQSRDVMFAVHGEFFPQEINRFSDTNWTIGPVQFKGGPAGPINGDPAKSIKSSALTGSVTLTATGFVFASTLVGGVVVLQQDNASYVKEWEAGVAIAEGDKRQYQGRVYANRKVAGVVATNTGTTPPTHTKGLRITGDTRPNWEYLHAGTGYVKITSVAVGGATAVAAVDGYLPEDLEKEGTTSFSMPAFTPGNGYPTSVVLYKVRIIYAGVEGLQQFGWCSRIDDFRNFAEGTLDDDAFKFRLGTGDLSNVTWLQPTRDVLTIGTENEEFVLRPLSASDPLTPVNSDVDPSTSLGSNGVQPIQIDDATLFVPYDGLGIGERTYNYSVDAFVTDRLEWEAEHVFTAPVKKTVRQKYPQEVEWVLLEDGTLVSFGYQRKQEYLAFAVHDLSGGIVEDIEEIPGATPTSHEIWLLVRREINGSTVRYIERFDDHFRWQAKTPVLRQSYLDCAKVYSAGPYTSLTGLSHLEGCEVRVMADGNDLGLFTVSGGTIDLENEVQFAICGLPFTSHLRTNMPVFPLRDGDSASSEKRPTRGLIWTVASAGGEIGSLDVLNGMEKIFDAIAEDFDQPCPFNTGAFEVSFPHGNSIDAPIDIICDTAMPFHVTALSPLLEVGG